MWSAIEQCDQTRSIPPLASHRLDLRIELIHQSRYWKMCPVLACFPQTDSKIFPHPINGESEIEFIGGHGLVAIFHLPGLCCAFGNRRYQLFDIEPRFLGKVQTFGETLHKPRNTDLVDHLRKLP